MNSIEINFMPVDHNSFTRLTNNDVISFSPGDSADYRFIMRRETTNDRNVNDSATVFGGQQGMASQMDSGVGSNFNMPGTTLLPISPEVTP